MKDAMEKLEKAGVMLTGSKQGIAKPASFRKNCESCEMASISEKGDGHGCKNVRVTGMTEKIRGCQFTYPSRMCIAVETGDGVFVGALWCFELQGQMSFGGVVPVSGRMMHMTCLRDDGRKQRLFEARACET